MLKVFYTTLTEEKTGIEFKHLGEDKANVIGMDTLLNSHRNANRDLSKNFDTFLEQLKNELESILSSQKNKKELVNKLLDATFFHLRSNDELRKYLDDSIQDDNTLDALRKLISNTIFERSKMAGDCRVEYQTLPAGTFRSRGIDLKSHLTNQDFPSAGQLWGGSFMNLKAWKDAIPKICSKLHKCLVDFSGGLSNNTEELRQLNMLEQLAENDTPLNASTTFTLAVTLGRNLIVAAAGDSTLIYVCIDGITGKVKHIQPLNSHHSGGTQQFDPLTMDHPDEQKRITEYFSSHGVRYEKESMSWYKDNRKIVYWDSKEKRWYKIKLENNAVYPEPYEQMYFVIDGKNNHKLSWYSVDSNLPILHWDGNSWYYDGINMTRAIGRIQCNIVSPQAEITTHDLDQILQLANVSRQTTDEEFVVGFTDGVTMRNLGVHKTALSPASERIEIKNATQVFYSDPSRRKLLRESPANACAEYSQFLVQETMRRGGSRDNASAGALSITPNRVRGFGTPYLLMLDSHGEQGERIGEACTRGFVNISRNIINNTIQSEIEHEIRRLKASKHEHDQILASNLIYQNSDDKIFTIIVIICEVTKTCAHNNSDKLKIIDVAVEVINAFINDYPQEIPLRVLFNAFLHWKNKTLEESTANTSIHLPSGSPVRAGELNERKAAVMSAIENQQSNSTELAEFTEIISEGIFTCLTQ